MKSLWTATLVYSTLCFSLLQNIYFRLLIFFQYSGKGSLPLGQAHTHTTHTFCLFMQDEKIWIHLLFLAFSYSEPARFGKAEDIWQFKQKTNLANHGEKADKTNVDEQIMHIKNMFSKDLLISLEQLLRWKALKRKVKIMWMKLCKLKTIYTATQN